MNRISVERYRPSDVCGVSVDDGPEVVVPITSEYAGLVEGVRDDGTSWLMYLDADGSPLVFWSQRGPAGEVIGAPISLQSGLEVDVEVTVDPA